MADAVDAVPTRVQPIPAEPKVFQGPALEAQRQEGGEPKDDVEDEGSLEPRPRVGPAQDPPVEEHDGDAVEAAGADVEEHEEPGENENDGDVVRGYGPHLGTDAEVDAVRGHAKGGKAQNGRGEVEQVVPPELLVGDEPGHGAEHHRQGRDGRPGGRGREEGAVGLGGDSALDGGHVGRGERISDRARGQDTRTGLLRDLLR